MSRITLVFTICSVIIAGAHVANEEAAPDRPFNPRPLNIDQPIGSKGKCYSCAGCSKVNNSTQIANCPLYRDSPEGCVTYSEKDKIRKDLHLKPWVVRGCASELGTCEQIRLVHNDKDLVQVLSCTECRGDNCNKNSAGSAVPNHFIAAMAMLATPILTKVYFSRM